MADTDSLDLQWAGALDVAEAVRDGRLTALEACEAAISRIEAMDGPINAVVVRDFERAREAAKALDKAGTKGDDRPLLGVPMTVKESNNVEGLPTTWGFEEYADWKADADSVVVSRLKKAGAIILGKTNVPVALADWQSFNPVYGQTVNPFDHNRSPGGSSGGSAAALATGMVPLEIGSDIGGSIRNPAHFCGVFGHKPTYGIVSRRGAAFPGTDGVEPPLSCVGPLARNVKDLSAALEIIQGPEEDSGYRLALPEPRMDLLCDARVIVMDEIAGVRADKDTRDAMSSLADALSDEGADVSDCLEGVPPLADMRDAYVKMLNIVTSRGTDRARPVLAADWMDLQDKQLDVTRAFKRFFENVDILISPVFSTPAFPHQMAADWEERELLVDNVPVRYGSQVSWATIATFAGLPSTVAPVSASKDGLPIGVQIMSAPFADRTTLRFAGLLEEAGLTRQPGYGR